MPDVVTFDGPNKIITEIAGGATNELDVIEIYSEWKEWVATSDNSKFLQGFGVVGGDPISSTQNLGSTFFLENGWRIRPAELDHKLTLIGNIFTREEGESVFLATIGAYTVNTETRVSNLVDSSVARLDLAQLLQEVYVTPDGVSGTAEGVGTPTNPSDNMLDARIIADRDNLHGYNFRGDYTITVDHEDWAFTGAAGVFQNTITASGVSMDGSKFVDLILLGMLSGQIDCRNTLLSLLTGLNGSFRNCGIIDTVVMAADAEIIMHNCFSMVPGISKDPASRPSLIFNGANEVNIRGYSGGLELTSVEDGASASVDLNQGTLALDNTCIGGTVGVRGVGLLIDNSAGTTVNSTGLLKTDEVDIMVQSAVGNTDVSPDDLTVTVRDKLLATLRELSLTSDKRTRRII